MLECQASLTVALGYRDLKPTMIGTCALPGTELEGRYERLLRDVRTSWTDALGRQTLQALEVLRQRTDTLEAGLSREIPQFGSTIRPARLEDIRSRLQPDELLIEFVDYSERDNRAACPRSAIDPAVQDLIAAANDWSVALAAGEKRAAGSAEETARDALRTLSEKLRPMMVWLAERKDVRRLRVPPDGMLSLVPFGALADEGGLFLIERFAISYVSAGRDLADAVLPSRAT